MQLQGSEERAHLLFENVTEVKLMVSCLVAVLLLLGTG